MMVVLTPKGQTELEVYSSMTNEKELGLTNDGELEENNC